MKFAVSFFILLYVVSGRSVAQSTTIFDKGKNLMGLSYNGHFGGTYEVERNFGARYGKFVARKFAVGAELFYGVNTTFYREYKPGIFARYYLGTRKFYPFVEISTYHSFFRRLEPTSFNSFATYIHSSYNEGRIGGGLAFNGLAKDKLSLELTLGWFTRVDNLYSELRLVFHFGR